MRFFCSVIDRSVSCNDASVMLLLVLGGGVSLSSVSVSYEICVSFCEFDKLLPLITVGLD